MSCTYNNYPSNFEILRPMVRGKALEMANILMNEGYDPQMAQTIAISNARQLACNKDGLLRIENKHVHMVPYPSGWALISENVITTYFICETKNEALVKSRSFAKNEKLKLFIHSEEGEIIDAESFEVNRPVHDRNNDSVITSEEKEILLIDSKREVYNKVNFQPKRRHSQLLINDNNFK
jgi:hypothetical protein